MLLPYFSEFPVNSSCGAKSKFIYYSVISLYFNFTFSKEGDKLRVGNLAVYGRGICLLGADYCLIFGLSKRSRSHVFLDLTYEFSIAKFFYFSKPYFTGVC